MPEDPEEQSDIPANPEKTKTKLRARTVFISDVHLGMPDCKAAQASHFIRNIQCDKLVMNGDIIDAWHLKRLGGWNKAHTHFIRTVLKKMEKENTQIIYLRGNHDDILDRFIPIRLDNFLITDEHIHHTQRGDYLVVHGDGFDHVTTNHPWIAKLGGIGYNLLLRVNRAYNWYRRVRGKDSFSLSRWVKLKVKSAVSFVGKYEEQLQELAKAKGCKGIICGHIHSPANKVVGDTHYLNSGDWVESLTAILEYDNGEFEVITYDQFCERTNREPKGDAVVALVDQDVKLGVENVTLPM
ncbi:UDP-2,3-diacylglucosamine pyrophosphatase LpxH [Prosthecobacter fusiformis]|uniref:UDP-2,3-diacylglucosamine pyrophosphatase LpxH n=1 Tax=Prosthecobacter fusiformis TaxID=48464 RepID=A0A4R7S435_9BACT|nr:UDP-2,3-diacylglucosamine diphosphatase [Prosthecobacter fusiformis]TDU73170.1 UDP-2,3-diacylglucosamine pyrophosphatase LpxH [Prosthecobacter fusiformis]